MRTPYVKADDLELVVTQFGFKCFVSPYFLSLTFKQQLAEDGREKAQWDVDRGEMTVFLPKKNKGEHFDNLDTLTELLTKPARKPGAGPAADRPVELVQVVDSQDDPSALHRGQGDAGEDDDGEEEEFDWEAEQAVPEPEAAEVLLSRPTYGFNNKYSSVFKDRHEYLTGVLELKDPDNVRASERRALREAAENEKMAQEAGDRKSVV